MILATKKGLNSVLKAYDSISQLTASAEYYTGLYKPALGRGELHDAVHWSFIKCNEAPDDC